MESGRKTEKPTEKKRQREKQRRKQVEKPMGERNILLVMEYDGSRYHGWQKQGNTEGTIQGKLEAVLGRMAGEPVEVHGSGRTDEGVHARGQIANVHLPESVRMEPEEILEYVNRYLPEDIRVLTAVQVPPRFHSRLSAERKTYRYYVETGKKAGVFERKYVYRLGEALDLDAMRSAAGFLVGEHDFKSFCGNRRMKKSTVRRLEKLEIHQEGTKVILDYTGNGFLYQMVRILTGSLLEVGMGKRKPEQMAEILEARDRQAAGFTAPPEGLFLMRVEYPEAALGQSAEQIGNIRSWSGVRCE